MTLPQPHYLLFCNTSPTPQDRIHSAWMKSAGGRWHFVLEQLDGSIRLEAADAEQSVHEDRLALLSVVRGLEALDQPSKVTLVTTSRYVTRGLRYGLSTWREAEYRWERFGEKKPIRNADLWRRIDGALQFHGVTCRFIGAKKAEPLAATSSAPALRPVEEAGSSLPSTSAMEPAAVESAAMEPAAASVKPTQLASPEADSLWFRRAEMRIQELELQLANWQAQEAAMQASVVPPRHSSWSEWLRKLMLPWFGWLRSRTHPNHALMGT